MIQEMTEKIIQIKQRIQATQDRQKSYADRKRKLMEFKVRDRVMLKVSPWKGVVRFIKWGKLNLRYIVPFKVLAKVGNVAYRLELPQELSRVHHTFHVSSLKKCYTDEPLAMPLEGVHIDDTLHTHIQETTEKIILIKQRIQAAQDRQKSYADRKRKPMKFEVGDRVMLKVLAKVGDVAYKLKLPQELRRVHHTFHVSNLKKCYADEPLAVSLEGVHIDDTLQFVEEPIKIMEREIKRLKRSQIPLVKVCWNSRRGSEFTWERKDSFKQKYPHLFTNRTSSSTTRS
nr:putative reverse transcriptase domain-containing protein [Tanacetum cinerariifolium]